VVSPEHGQRSGDLDPERAGPVTHVVGARPNFMKAAPVIRALASLGVEQRLVHTGQHYDAMLSDWFFSDLGLRHPDANLDVGSGTHAQQTASAMTGLERDFNGSSPKLAIVYGDINSTIAAAIVAAKAGIPLAHVEAGLRSFDDSMPEEINRRVTDLLSSLLFATSPDAVENLRAMGIPGDRVHFVGNPMIDSLVANLGRLDEGEQRARFGLPDRYAVATLHRPGNVDDPVQAERMVAMLGSIAELMPIVLPLHPRGRPRLEAAGLRCSRQLQVIDPLGYLDFLSLVRGSALVVTDSGGLQEETTFLGIPCLTVRPNTERPITISNGTNQLVTPEAASAVAARALSTPREPGARVVPPLWDGHAGSRIAEVVVGWLGREA